MKISSEAFGSGERIPEKYTCDGQDISPPLRIDGLPDGTESVALIVDDPDAPMGTWTHWVVWGMEGGDIEEDSVPGKQGLNDFKKTDYGGPCPPSGEHRYFFRAYALDMGLDLDEGASREEVEEAMEGHILEEAELMGVYSRR